MSIRPAVPVAPLQFTNALFLCAWGVVAVVLLALVPLPPPRADAWLLQGAIHVAYSLAYLAPGWLVVLMAVFVTARLGVRTGNVRAARLVGSMGTFAVLLLVLGFLAGDHKLHRLYGFHVNGFVLNLLTTRGGLESLGASGAELRTLALGMVAGLIAALMLGLGAARLQRLGISSRRVAVLCLLGVTVFGAGQLAYAVAQFRADESLMQVAGHYPLFVPTTARRLARQLGFTEASALQNRVSSGDGPLRYPPAGLRVQRPEHPFNVLWLVVESWRNDMLDPQIMPRTSAFAATSIRSREHYSGGNGTRMGVFSMFYGIYGSYWGSMLAAHQSPVLLDVLQDQGYRIGAWTSASFSYPEFSSTVWANLAPRQLHEEEVAGVGWVRDRGNTANLLKWIDAGADNTPFFAFQFFETPHAPYNFPETRALRANWLHDLNYVTLDPAAVADQLFARYVNACHELDDQIGVIIDHLQARGLLDNTIVVLTGDHGEAFMEKGFWGHNSNFDEEQVRVPLIVHIPGQGARELVGITSHLDLPATLAPLLGIRTPAQEWSLGENLLASRTRDYAVAADWNRIAYLGPQVKSVYATTLAGAVRGYVTARDDSPLSPDAQRSAGYQRALAEVLQGMGQFRRHDTPASSN